MYSSENALDVIARCGGYFKRSIIKNLVNPHSFFVYLGRKNELNPLFKRAPWQGERIYFLPPKYVVPYYRFKPREVNEYSIFKSFALILYFIETVNLPYTGKLQKRHFPDEPVRTYNGVYNTLDDNTGEHIVIIVDYYKTEKKLLRMIDTYRNHFDFSKNPVFHLVTFRPRFPIINILQDKRPEDRIEVFSYPELTKIF